MIEAHTFDAWTAVADRARTAYGYAVVLAGGAAPLFLFLAGLSLTLTASRRVRNGAAPWATAWQGVRRGGFIFTLAMLFRLQSWVLSGGTQPLAGLLKVDILNVMAASCAAVAVVWGLGRRPWSRVAALLGAATVVAMSTPLVRLTPLLDGLPDALESYIRPLGGRGTFSLFPWSGFVAAGAAAGVFMEAVAGSRERLAYRWLALAGAAVAAAAYWASFQPRIYPDSYFWTTSPTFFFIRVGLLLMMLWVGRSWDQRVWFRTATGGDGPVTRAIQAFGRSSLLVYWVHVELTYGVIAYPIKKLFSLEQMLLVYPAFVLLMYGMVVVWHRWSERRSVAVST